MNAMAREKQNEVWGWQGARAMPEEGEKPDENGHWRCMQMKPERAAKKDKPERLASTHRTV